jgi:hypothetical protein
MQERDWECPRSCALTSSDPEGFCFAKNEGPVVLSARMDRCTGRCLPAPSLGSQKKVSVALLERRRPLDLYHSALEVCVPEGRFVIENSWPIPDANGASRSVVVEGPVGSRRIARIRALRYEIHRWRDGVIPDADEAVGSPQHLSDDPRRARRLLDLVGSVPSMVWGRDELRTGEMWNSNSVIAWLLARCGLPTEGSALAPADTRPDGTQASLRRTARRGEAA